MQSKKELENWYTDTDPWKYQTNKDDEFRRQKILDACGGTYERALDIGAGEGWITKDLPAKEIHAIELSDVASSRFPNNVTRVDEPKGKYDLIIATGVLYQQYDWKRIHKWIEDSAVKRVVTCNIQDWEIPLLMGKEIHTEAFPYRDYTQKLRVYDVSTA